jgi:hypothetical protein
MRNAKPIEISVKTVFTGMESAEQVFIDLIRLKNAEKTKLGLESLMQNEYNTSNVVFPAVHAPERGICYE